MLGDEMRELKGVVVRYTGGYNSLGSIKTLLV